MPGASAPQPFVPPPGFEALSVVMPCYRLGPVVAANLRRAEEAMRAAGIAPFELVPVDDGSGDGTPEAFAEAARELGADVVRPVVLPANRGKGEAFRAGFEASRGSHVLLLDGDLDLDPAYAPRFFRVLAETGADVAIGSKMHPESRVSYPLRRRIASRAYYGLVKALFRLPVHDTQTGMKLFRREALQYAFARSLSKRFAFDLELLVIAGLGGFRVAEAPVSLDYPPGKWGALEPSAVADVLRDTLAVFYRVRVLRYYQSLEPRPMPAKRPRVAAVVACPAVTPMLEQCVAALARERETYPELEAVVLPDSPSGRQWPAWVREIPTGAELPSDKRNAGAAAADGAEIVAFLDDDARPLPGWLANAVPHFSDPGTCAVGGPAATPPEDGFMAAMSGRVYASPLVSGAYRRRYVPTRVCAERDLPSCNLLVRASALREAGGFDSAYWPGEDTVLCLDLSKLGRIVYDPRVVAAHHRRPLFGPHLRQVSRYARHRGFFAKRFPETSLKPAYFAPSALLLGTLGEALCALAWTFFRTGAFGTASGDGMRACAVYAFAIEGPARAGGCVLAAYAAAVLLFSFSRKPLEWAATAAGIAATHYAYGWNFLRGQFARAMPDGVRDVDHQGAAAPAKATTQS